MRSWRLFSRMSLCRDYIICRNQHSARPNIRQICFQWKATYSYVLSFSFFFFRVEARLEIRPAGSQDNTHFDVDSVLEFCFSPDEGRLRTFLRLNPLPQRETLERYSALSAVFVSRRPAMLYSPGVRENGMTNVRHSCELLTMCVLKVKQLYHSIIN